MKHFAKMRDYKMPFKMRIPKAVKTGLLSANCHGLHGSPNGYFSFYENRIPWSIMHYLCTEIKRKFHFYRAMSNWGYYIFWYSADWGDCTLYGLGGTKYRLVVLYIVNKWTNFAFLYVKCPKCYSSPQTSLNLISLPYLW